MSSGDWKPIWLWHRTAGEALKIDVKTSELLGCVAGISTTINSELYLTIRINGDRDSQIERNKMMHMACSYMGSC